MRPSAGLRRRGAKPIVRRRWNYYGLVTWPRGDPLLELLDVQLDGAGVLARRGLDLGLLLFGKLETNRLLSRT